MNQLIKRLALIGALLTVASTAIVGCAQDIEDVNRVQPNAIKKSDMSGEWYYQRTIVEMPGSDGFTFVGATDNSGLTKLKWDIQEDYLYGRRQTPLIENADQKQEEGEDYQGEVVAAYRIQSHFDIQRQYNPQTGEQTNVIVENRTDKPWDKREYMRVDWSTNLVTNYNLDFESETIEPVPYYVQEEHDPETGEVIPNPNAPVFDYKQNTIGDGKTLQYFDITNRIHAQAGTIYFPGYGDIPKCWLISKMFSECGSSEYTIRNSFKRIDPDHQYVPKPYKGKVTELFGFFKTDRNVYDDHTGIREQQKKRYINRHNMWKRWYDSDGNLIPVPQRELEPIVYFANRDMPDDLKPIGQDVADDWNEIFDDVVQAQGYQLDEGERTFIFCANNPVQEGDPAACGEPGNSPRLGDLRYSFLAYVPKFMEYGLLGFGPANKDPETGEIISGMAYVYHWNNTAAYRTEEMVELLNGDRDVETFINGVDLTQWVDQTNNPGQAPQRTFNVDQNEAFVQNIANRWDGPRNPVTQADVDLQKEQGFDAFIQPRLDAMYHRGQLNGERSSPDGKLGQLQGSYIEDLLLTDEVLTGAGHIKNTPVTAQDIQAASVAQGGLGHMAMEREKLRRKYAAERNMFLPSMADDALMGLAREVEGDDPDDVYTKIRNTIYHAVLAHESGHSLGLMHNFGGSEDAVNYFDKYWKIRDDGNVGPRMNDPITDAEINQNIYNYGYSSIMDYAGRYTIDGKGVGKYDRAAMLYGYAGKVEVFKDSSGVRPQTLRDWADMDGQVLQFTRFGPKAVNYTSLYNQMGDRLYKDDNRMLVDVAKLDVNDGVRDWSTATVNGQTYQRVPYLYCSHRNYNLSDSCLTRDFGADSYERMNNMLDKLNTWYITRAFPRGKMGRSSYSYVNSYYPSIYHRLKYWNDLYGLYADLLPTIYSPSQVQDFLTDPVNGWAGKTWAVKNAFNYLMQTIMMPNVGDVQKLTKPDGQEYYGSPETAVDGELDVTQGRYYATSWRPPINNESEERRCGYFFDECLHHIGFYLDKIMAMEALSETRTNFVARATPEDIRQWEIGYFNTFPKQMLKLNNALMSEKWSQFAPHLDTHDNDDSSDDEMVFPDYSGDMSGSMPGTAVDPYATFTIKLYWQVLGQARFPSSYRRSFVDESRVYLQGTGSAPDFDDSDQVEFTDPWNNFTYGAANMEAVNGYKGSGQGMIERANMLLRRSNMCDDDTTTMPTTDDCEPGVSARTRADATRELHDYVDLLKVLADLTPTMQYGSPYAP